MHYEKNQILDIDTMLYVGTMLNKLQKLCSSLNFWQFAVFYLFGLLHSKFTPLCLGKNPLRIPCLLLTLFWQHFKTYFGRKDQNTFFWPLSDLLVAFRFLSAFGQNWQFCNPLIRFWSKPSQLNSSFCKSGRGQFKPDFPRCSAKMDSSKMTRKESFMKRKGVYRVAHLHADLGWVDLRFKISTSLLGQ